MRTIKLEWLRKWECSQLKNLNLPMVNKKSLWNQDKIMTKLMSGTDRQVRLLLKISLNRRNQFNNQK